MKHPKLTDCSALDAMSALMNGTEWSPDTMDEVARLIRATGRGIADSASLAEAAPDMYAALEDLVRTTLDGRGGVDAQAFAWAAARLALAKARGEES